MTTRLTYGYRARWSPEDRQYAGTVVEFPALSHLAATLEGALAGIRTLVAGVIADLYAAGEPAPAPAPLPDPAYRVSAASAARSIRAHLAVGDVANAMREVWGLGGSLTGAPIGLLPALTDAVPELTGSEKYDVLLAAITDHVLSYSGLPVPPWVAERTLSETWAVEEVDALRPAAQAASSDAVLRHGIWLDVRDLTDV